MKLRPETATWLATWLLRIIGGSICLALFPIFFPLSLMATIHERLGLGTIPEQPIFEYLARSLSAMYFAHGLIVLAISTDVRRYQPLVGVIGGINLVLGVVLLMTDLWAPMPSYWTILEGPPIVAVGGCLLWIWRQIEQTHSA